MTVLIVGLGSIAQKHIQALKELFPDNLTIYALRSSTNAIQQHEINNVYDYKDLEKIKFNFAIICNPTSIHYETIEKLITHNIPLFIEKPLFSKLKPFEVVSTIEKKGIITYVGCNLRFLDSLKFVKNYTANKRINEVNIYCGSYLPNWRPNKDYKSTYSANKDLGGGVHIDLIHEVDYAYWLFGKPNGVTKVFSNKSSLDINAYDYANYIFEYDNFNISIVLNYYRQDPKRSLEIVMEDETVLVDILNNKVYKGDDVIFKSDKKIVNTYKDQLKFFTEQILTKQEKFNTVEEAYEILKICLQKD